LQASVDALGSAGVKIDDSRRPCDLTASNDLYQRLMQATLSMAPPQEAFDSLVELAGHAEADDESPAVRWARNVTQRARDWNLALEQRAQLRARWADFFTDFDVLLCPIEPVTAIPHDHRPIEERSRSITVSGERRDYWEQIVWAGLAGMVYLPGTVAPVGPAADGLPVGIQIVGPYLEDLTTIRFAELLVGVVGGYRPPPMAL
jgi:amidase